jgi:hypothetical protein
MEVYNVIQLNNGDILLKKVIIDVTKYNQKIKENGDILFEKINEIVINEFADLNNYNFTNSEIVQCYIDNKNITKLKYKSILTEIYSIIDNGSKIIKKTLLNIETLKKEVDGFYYLENIGISVQGVDSNKCIKEIVNQCICNNISIKMKINLTNGDIIKIDI